MAFGRKLLVAAALLGLLPQGCRQLAAYDRAPGREAGQLDAGLDGSPDGLLDGPLSPDGLVDGGALDSGTPGTVVWGKPFGSVAQTRVLGIASDAQRRLAVVGESWGTFSLPAGIELTNAGAADGYLLVFEDGVPLWGATMGGASVDIAHAVAFDGSDVLVTGEFRGPKVDFAGTSRDAVGSGGNAFLLRLDPDGHVRWLESLDSTDEALGLAVAVDPQGTSYLVGAFRGDIALSATVSSPREAGFVASFNRSGQRGWSKGLIPTTGSQPTLWLRGAAVSGSTLWVVGELQGGATLGTFAPTSKLDSVDALAVSLNSSNGAVLWAERFGGDQQDIAWGVASTPAQTGVWAVGEFIGSAAFGTKALNSAGSADVFVGALETGGAKGAFRYGGQGHESALAIASDADGFVVAGEFDGVTDLGGGLSVAQGPTDVFVASYGASGEHRWSRTFGGNGASRATSVALLPGQVCVGGDFHRTLVVDTFVAATGGQEPAGFVVCFRR